MRPLLIGHVFDHRGKHFAGAAGRSDDQTLAVGFDDRPRQTRFFIVIIQMGIRDQLVDVLQSLLGLCQNDDVIGRLALVVDAAVLVDAVRIVEHIALQAVDDLDLASFFRLFLGFGRTVRESLHHAVISDRDRRLPPFGCHRHDVLGLVEAVHLAHLGVDMQFHTASVLPGILPADRAVRLFEVLEHDRVHILKGIPLHFAADLDAVSGFEQLVDLIPLVFADKRLGADRCLVVGDQKRHQVVAAFDDTLALTEQHALQDDRSQLRYDLPQLRGLAADDPASHDAVALCRQFFFPALPAAALSFAAKTASAAPAAVCSAEAASEPSWGACLRMFRFFRGPVLQHFPILAHRTFDILCFTFAERTHRFFQQRVVIFKQDLHFKTERVVQHLAEFLRHLFIQLLRRDLAEHRAPYLAVPDRNAVFEDRLGDGPIGPVEDVHHVRHIQSGRVFRRHHEIPIGKDQLDILDDVQLMQHDRLDLLAVGIRHDKICRDRQGQCAVVLMQRALADLKMIFIFMYFPEQFPAQSVFNQLLHPQKSAFLSDLTIRLPMPPPARQS